MLQALYIGKGSRVKLEGEDFGVEAFGTMAENLLLKLDASEDNEYQKKA